jgi:hypothetical protein
MPRRQKQEPGSELSALGGQVGKQGEELRHLRKAAEKTLRAIVELRRENARLQHQLEALIRRQAVSGREVPFPERLTNQRFGIHSQAGEDGLLLAILDEVGTDSCKFAVLGCGTNGGNGGFLAAELGWSGLMADVASVVFPELRRSMPAEVEMREVRVTRETVNEILAVAGDIDVLDIDIDGNDYWVWQATEVRPRVVVIEFNSAFGPERQVTIAYDPDFEIDTSLCGGLYHGASLAALAALGKSKGYRLVATENVNAFFVRDDLAQHLPTLSPADGYRLYSKHARRLERLGGDLDQAFASAGLDLVEVSG